MTRPEQLFEVFTTNSAGAEKGRVDAVFVASDEIVCGLYEPHTAHAAILPKATLGAEDLLDRIAAATWIHGGRVHVVPATEVPRGVLVAALYRYPQSTPTEACVRGADCR